MEGVFVQCEDAVEKCYEELRCGVWTDERKAALRAQVLAVADPNNQVRKLMRKAYFLHIIYNVIDKCINAQVGMGRGNRFFLASA